MTVSQGQQLFQVCYFIAHQKQVFKIGESKRNILDDADFIIGGNECANPIKEGKPTKLDNHIIAEIDALKVVLNRRRYNCSGLGVFDLPDACFTQVQLSLVRFVDEVRGALDQLGSKYHFYSNYICTKVL